jgi:ribosomal protein S18 acetylase RimI-like enzyme
VLLRQATAEDTPALTGALLEAVNWDGQARFTVEQLLADPHLAHYVTDWPRPSDFGTVAIDDGAGRGGDGEVLGAACCRLLDATDPGYGYLADDIPEVTIGVAPAHRGRGVGSALLVALIEQARVRGHRAISLSVEDSNRARALYERAGFTAVGRNGGSDTMRLHLNR